MATNRGRKLTREEVLRPYNPENNDRLYPRRGERSPEPRHNRSDSTEVGSENAVESRAYHRPKKKTAEELEEQEKTRQWLASLGVDTEDLALGSSAGELPATVDPVDRTDPEAHPTWRQADEEFAGFLRDVYDLPVISVLTGIQAGQRRVEFDEDTGVFSIDMLCIGLPGPVDEGPGITGSSPFGVRSECEAVGMGRYNM